MMNNNKEILARKEEDIRWKATIWMWGLSVPLFFACVPIIALSAIGILLPLFVLIALTLGTASVWFSYSKSINAVSQEIQELQERIVNLETIASHEELDGKFRALEQTALKNLTEIMLRESPQNQTHSHENTPN